jgi:hypothetical protein
MNNSINVVAALLIPHLPKLLRLPERAASESLAGAENKILTSH